MGKGNSGLFPGTGGGSGGSNQTTNPKLPVKSKPSSRLDLVDSNGSKIRSRFFDSEGKVYRDIDYTNHGNPKTHPIVPHEHQWTWYGDKPIRNSSE